MRRRAKVDSCQAAITKKLRQMGVFVEPALSRLGGGVPDLLCAYRGVWLLVELKDGTKPPSGQKLTQDEERWHEAVDGRGPIMVATNAESIFKFLNLLCVQPPLDI